jgi:hypothetical protein
MSDCVWNDGHDTHTHTHTHTHTGAAAVFENKLRVGNVPWGGVVWLLPSTVLVGFRIHRHTFNFYLTKKKKTYSLGPTSATVSPEVNNGQWFAVLRRRLPATELAASVSVLQAVIWIGEANTRASVQRQF